MRSTMVSAGRRRLVLALLTLTLAVGGQGVTDAFDPNLAAAVTVDGGDVGNMR